MQAARRPQPEVQLTAADLERLRQLRREQRAEEEGNRAYNPGGFRPLNPPDDDFELLAAEEEGNRAYNPGGFRPLDPQDDDDQDEQPLFRPAVNYEDDDSMPLFRSLGGGVPMDEE